MASRLRGNKLVRLSVIGAGRGDVASFTKAQRTLQDELNKGMNVLGQRATKRIRESGVVPENEGTLESSLRSVFFTQASRVQVTITASAKRDGYDYTGVTRFGHRVSVIRPKRKRQVAAKRVGRTAWLTVFFGRPRSERATLLPQVRGVRVQQDWAELARDEISDIIDRAQAEMGRNVASRILRQ